MSPGAAPRVDAVVAGQIGWRDDVRTHLRSVEQEARALKDEIEVVLLTGGADDPLLRSVSDEIARVLDDPARSPLLRALARRPADLGPGRAGRRSLDTRWGAIRGRAHAALDRYDAAAALRKALARLRSRFVERLPWHLARALERARIGEADADRTDVAAIRARVGRLARIEEELEERSAELPLRAEPPLEVGEWPAEVSPEELAWAVELAGREEGGDPAGWRERARRMADTHRTRLLGSTPAPARGADAAEAAAREVASLVTAGVRPGAEDVDAWGIVLRAAARDRNPAGPVMVDIEPPHAETGALLFVIPLFGPYVLVRTGRPWPVRVEGRAVRCGVPAPVIAALPPGAGGIALPPESWAEPLFSLPPNAGAEWLTTSQPAEVVPFARIGGGSWLAAVVRKGALTPAGEAAWRPPPRSRRPALRLLAGAELARGEEPIVAGPPSRGEMGPFGWRTDIVPVALADVPEAWLRSASNPAGRDHVEAEQSFFQAVGLRLPGRAPRCLGRTERGGSGYLYAPPLAFRTGDSAPLRAWELDDPLAFVTAAARLWKALRDAGLALGFYHPATLGFRVRFGPRDGAEPPLDAMALAAPLGTRLGANYRRSREVVQQFPAYERLGQRLPPAQLAGEVALPETEALAFALYALDRLLTDPVEIPPGAPWDEFVDMLHERGRYAVPVVADVLVSPLVLTEGRELLAAAEALAHSRPLLPAS